MLMGHVQTSSTGRGTQQHFSSKLDACGAIFPTIRDAARPGRPRCESNSSSWGWAPSSFLLLLLPPLPLRFQRDVFVLSLQARIRGDLPIPPQKAP